ncbi:TfuA-like protein [Roseospira goensis]|uniref:TfuA-like core domain-containing protein n=1 Tax=Roseospira goensis TaxID=391922 RepID=A0A7W6RZV2_9PROT|nr:TfuA-like protein [Roseospira goensis]MBB4286278.1 hypothetical protein [Roseospira goensis]
MSLVVFLGPTLPAREVAARLPEADLRPPVSQGDVLRAVQAGARAIGIVDGYFERVPAVWHKEILWALSRGVVVYGAASMGALRAAELHPFGMVGVGAVFAAFRDGVLEDDDEVTVAHGPAEIGYPLTSVALVDMRATLEAARAAGVVSPATHEALIALAKRTYYPNRSYEALLADAAAAGLPADETAALAAWLSGGRVERKAADARALLDALADLRDGAAPPPPPPAFHFERTDAWEQVARRDGHQVAAAVPDAVPLEALLDELRLRGTDYHRTLSVCFARALALQEAERHPAPLDRAVFREVLHGFFQERGLRTPAEIADWLAVQRLDADDLTAFIAREARIARVETLARDAIRAQVPDALRGAGLYGPLATRAEAKRRWLAEAGLEAVGAADRGQDADGLLRWHFTERRGEPVPADLEAHARALGLANRHALLQMLVREFLYVRHVEGDPAPASAAPDGADTADDPAAPA